VSLVDAGGFGHREMDTSRSIGRAQRTGYGIHEGRPDTTSDQKGTP
jgi:hypothetical protein